MCEKQRVKRLFELIMTAAIMFSPLVLEASDPKLLWQYQSEAQASLSGAGDLVFSFQNGTANGYSCPAIGADGTIYFGAYDSKLYAIQPNGALKWAFRTGARLMKPPSLGSDGTIYIGSDDGYLYAVNPDGVQKWRFQARAWINSPAIGPDGNLYAGDGAGYFYALDSRGNLEWEYYLGQMVHDLAAIGPNGTIYFTTFWENHSHYYLYALDRVGAYLWRVDSEGWFSKPSVGSDGTVYAGTYGKGLIAVNPDGKVKWRFSDSSDINAAPSIGLDGTVYYIASDGTLKALNPDGSLKWIYGGLSQSIMCSQPALGADGTIYFGSPDHYFYAFDKDGKLKWKFLVGAEVNCPPTLSDSGIIYFGSMGKTLYALDSGTGAGLAASSWPKYGRDTRNSSNLFSASSVGGILRADSVITAFDSAFVLAVDFDLSQALIGFEFKLHFDTNAVRLDSAKAGRNAEWLNLLALNIPEANQTGEALIQMLDLSLDHPLGPGSGELARLFFTVTASQEADFPLPLSGYSGSTAEGTRVDLLAQPGRVRIKQVLRDCDLNGDGVADIADLVAFLIAMRNVAYDPLWDWNSDGVIGIADAVSFLIQLRSGGSDSSTRLASSNETGVANPLTMEEISYLRQMMENLPLSTFEREAFENVLKGMVQVSLPRAFALGANYPNPFNPSTTITYRVPEGAPMRVSLKVYNLRGQLVSTLVDSPRPPGEYSVVWNGTDNSGLRLPSGVYLYRMSAGAFHSTRKMVLLK